MSRWLKVLAWCSWGLGTYTLHSVGLFYAGLFLFASGQGLSAHSPYLAWWYVGPVLAILAAHEFGHLIAARRCGLKTHGPFLIPWPLAWAHYLPMVPALGLLGAFVKIRRYGPLSSLQGFDIAWAGVMGGAVATGLCTAVGAFWSVPVVGMGLEARGWTPHLISWILGPGLMAWHPILAAARFGWLVTVVNLFFPCPLADGWRMIGALPDVWAERRWHLFALAGLCLLCGW